ncbi:MAG TPA: hypothetical protein VFQ61_26995 [Polyangiaceae bacterium]|nr:hypothetical protein [Polyangiaceae bacterium]
MSAVMAYRQAKCLLDIVNGRLGKRDSALFFTPQYLAGKPSPNKPAALITLTS